MLNRLQSPLLFLMRLYWGWGFFMAGKGKFVNLERVTEFFGNIGIPAPPLSAILAGTAECLGGLCLLVGFASRLASIPLVFTMVVAYLTAHPDIARQIFSDPNAFVTADPFLFLLTSLLVMIFGPGRCSIDAVIKKKWPLIGC